MRCWPTSGSLVSASTHARFDWRHGIFGEGLFGKTSVGATRGP